MADLDVTFPALTGDFGHVWDEIYFDDVQFPPGGTRLPRAHGKVEVEVKRGRDLGTHRTGGRDGGRIVDKGLKPAEIKLTLTAWDEDGTAALRQLRAIFEPLKRIQDRRPIRVSHPTLAWHQIDTIYVGEVDGPKPLPALQGAIVAVLTCVQHTPPSQRRAGVTRTAASQPLARGVVAIDGTRKPIVEPLDPRSTNTGP